jgi:hypothetical protein
MTTLVPTLPLVGVNDVIVGAAATVKLATLLTWEKVGVVTRIGPFVAPTGTTAVTDVAEFTVTLTADVALNTTVAPQRFVPVIVTLVPTGPLVGVNDEIVGASVAKTSKLSLATSVDVPSPFVTLTLVAPVAAPHGTVAVSVVGPVTVNGADAPPIVTVVTAGFWKSEPVTLTTVPRTPDTGDTGAVTCGVVAQAGSAVTSTPTTASVSVSAAAFFFWNLTERSSLQGVAAEPDERHSFGPATRCQTGMRAVASR